MGTIFFIIILIGVFAVLFLLIKQRQKKTLTRQIEMYKPFERCETENLVNTWLKYGNNGGIVFALNKDSIDVFSVMPTDSTAAKGCSFKILDNGIGVFDYGYSVNNTDNNNTDPKQAFSINNFIQKQLFTKLEAAVPSHKIWFLQPFNIKHLFNIEKSTIEEIDSSVNSLLLYANGKMLKFNINSKYPESGEAVVRLVVERLIAYCTNGDLTSAKNIIINEKISDIMKEDAIAKAKANLKIAGAIVGGIVAIGVGSAVGSAASNWKRDVTLSSI
jgi:predicted Holliday junction resolvase-like endonuclease